MSPSFDTWTIVFLVAAAQGAFIALVLWRWKRGDRQGNRLLALLLALFSLSMLEYVLYWTNYIYVWPAFSNISVNFTFFYGSILWLYLRTIFEGKPLSKWDAWHLIPFILASLPFLPWYFGDIVEKQQVIAGKARFVWVSWAIQLQFWVRMAHLAGFVIWNGWYLYKQPRVGDTARWARLLWLFHFGFAAAYVSYFVLIQFPFFNLSWDYHISAVMTAMIYLIAYAGYVQPQVFEGYKWLESNLPTKYKNSGLTTEASRSLLQNLGLLMEQERMYHDPEISLDKLAHRLGASKHHVSQVINEHLEVSFFEYVNKLRIEEAKLLLAETSRSDLHVIEVAYAVGFNNKVSFNAAFKRATGLTPTAYRRNHGNSDAADTQPRAAQ